MLSDKPYFFAGSDDEDETIATKNVVQQPETNHPDSAERTHEMALDEGNTTNGAEPREPLFFAGSDDESEPPVVDDAMIVDDSEYIPPPRSSSPPAFGDASGPPSVRSLSRSPSIRACSPPPVKKRRISPPPQVKKPRLNAAYVGTLLIGNAWSTARGKGYIKPGEPIRVEIDAVEDASTSKSTTSKTSGPKDKSKKKQTTLTNAFQSKTAKPAKKKLTTIVRLTNDRGFGMFRHNA